MRRSMDVDTTNQTRLRYSRPARLRLPALLLVGILALVGIVPASLLTVSEAHADPGSNGMVQIVVPNNNGSSQGPVGTNITISGTGLTPSDTYTVGYAPQDTGGCSSGVTPLEGVGTVMTDGNGNLTADDTFQWPQSLANVGSAYFICLQDAANSVAQSQTTFTVAGSSPPAIQIKPAAVSSPGTTTPTPPSGFYPGGAIEVDGSSYLPGGTELQVYLSSTPISTTAQLSQATQLSLVQGQSITSSNSGQVTAVVQIPTSVGPGQYYLYLVSTDSQGTALPSLMNNVGISITTAPAPTPTTVPATVTPTQGTTSPITPSAPSGPSSGQLAAVVGLGFVSFVLFVVGIFLLVSASMMPREA